MWININKLKNKVFFYKCFILLQNNITGAAFSDSIVRGITIGMAVLSQQFPQELGKIIIWLFEIEIQQIYDDNVKDFVEKKLQKIKVMI